MDYEKHQEEEQIEIGNEEEKEVDDGFVDSSSPKIARKDKDGVFGCGYEYSSSSGDEEQIPKAMGVYIPPPARAAVAAETAKVEIAEKTKTAKPLTRVDLSLDIRLETTAG